MREAEPILRSMLWREHVTVDFVHPEADLAKYKLVVAPSLYLLGEAGSKNLHRYTELGGNLLVSYFSGIVDELDTVHMGPYPGALRETLGLWIEEFHPLREGEQVALNEGTGRTWSERVRLAGAAEVAAFADGPDAGHPAITRHALGSGHAWYVATAPSNLDSLLKSVLDAACVSRPSGLPDTLEVVRRGGHVFLLNHGDEPAEAYGANIPGGGSVII